MFHSECSNNNKTTGSGDNLEDGLKNGNNTDKQYSQEKNV